MSNTPPKFITGNVTTSRVGVGQGLDQTTDPAPLSINPDRFANLVRTHGMPVTWMKALLCPNRVQTPAPGDHDPNCTTCDQGYLYIDPVETVMAIQGATLEQAFYIQGRFDGGTAQITCLPENPVSYWDKVIMKASTIRYTETVRRSANSTADLLRYPVISILHLQDGTRVYTQGRDFKLVNGNTIQWTSNKNFRPDDADYYSVMYTRRPTYIILDMVRQHSDVPDNVAGGTRPMPLKVTAKLDFLIRDESKDPQPVASTSPFSEDSN